MTSFTDPGLTQDYMKENPGAFRTATTRRPTRLVAQARPLPRASSQMINGAGVLRGISAVGEDASPLLVILRDGADANALPILVFQGPNSDGGPSSVEMFPVPIQFRYGLYCEIVGGNTGRGCIYTDEIQD